MADNEVAEAFAERLTAAGGAPGGSCVPALLEKSVLQLVERNR
jgi:hypothetical protein